MLKSFVQRLVPGHGAILAYHGVTTAARGAAALVHVPDAQLAEGVALLQSLGRIVPLAELLARVENGQSTAGLFALTFDDAYESVLRVALPILRAHDAPATVFPVSRSVLVVGRFWWDRIEDAAAHANAAQWESVEGMFGVGRGAGLEAVRQRILRAGGRLTIEDDEIVAALEAAVGRSTSMRPAAVQELLELARDPLISIGSHTATHACLKYLPDDEVIAEIRECDKSLREMGLPVLPVLAVPYGMGDERTVGLARRAGMAWSLGVAPRTLRGASAERPIPRFAMSRRRAGLRFEAQVRGSTEWVKGLLGREAPDWPE